MVELARRLRRKRAKAGQRSLREIAAELEKAGYVSRQVSRMVQRLSPGCWESYGSRA